jgi:serine/threonine protein kinase
MSDNYDLRDDFDDQVLLAQGGMGAVYLAKQRSLNRTVVVKTILSGERIPAESATRLISEGRLLAKLAHPNIVTVYDLKQTEAAVYLIEEYVQGSDLRGWMRDRNATSTRITPAVFWRLARQMISALVAAHSVGIIHRDLKPENILIREDLTIKLCDFGISTITTESEKRMSSSSGTLAYMAPELFDDEPRVSKAIDYYSLGCILYELLCGANPFVKSADDSIGRIIKVKLTNSTLDFGVLPSWFFENQSDLKELLALDPVIRQGAFDRLSVSATKEDPVGQAGGEAQVTMTAVNADLRRYIASASPPGSPSDAKSKLIPSRNGALSGNVAESGTRVRSQRVNWYRGIKRIVLTLAVLASLFILVALGLGLSKLASDSTDMRSNPNYSKWVQMLADPRFVGLPHSSQERLKEKGASEWGLEKIQAEINETKVTLLLVGLAIPALWAVLFLLRWFLRGFITTGIPQKQASKKAH